MCTCTSYMYNGQAMSNPGGTMRRLNVKFLLFAGTGALAYALMYWYMCDPRIVAAPAGPREISRRTNWVHQAGGVRLDERSFERRFASRGGWAAIERCRRPLSVLLLVYSAPPARSRRAVFRDTLLEKAASQRFNWTAVFFTGRRRAGLLLDAWVDLELNTTGDVVEFAFEDTDAAMTAKFVAAMRWVADNCPRVEYVIKMDDDVLIEPFQLQQYLKSMAPLKPRSLHCYVWKKRRVVRDRRRRSFETFEDVPDRFHKLFCSGRSIIMNFDVMRDLLRAASLVRPHSTDDTYVTGELALVNSIGHVDIKKRYEWKEGRTDCIFNGSCMFTHEYSTYALNLGHRSQWGLVLWRQRLDAGETLDLSTRLETADYAEEFKRTRALLKVVPACYDGLELASSDMATASRNSAKVLCRPKPENFLLRVLKGIPGAARNAFRVIA